MPDVGEDGVGARLEQRSQLAVIIPGAGHGACVDSALGGTEAGTLGWDVGLRVIQADVALALLLGVVERVRVQERPNKLPANVLEAKLKVRVLINGVVAAVERGGADA